MNDKTTTDGAPPAGVARLLGIGVSEPGQEPTSPDEEKACLLEAELAAAFALAPGALEGFPVGGRALGDLLLDRGTALAPLQAVKARYKGLCAAKGDEPAVAVATTVYFAAIAGALLSHGARITRYSHERLADAFGRLADQPWMAPELAELFREARRASVGNVATRDSD